jgi:hypothetical protein
MPDVGDASHAVFVGKVVEFYPKSREQWNQRVEEFYHTHRDLRESLMAQLQNTDGLGRQTSRPAGVDSLELIWRKAMIEDIWADSLNPAELQQLRAVTKRSELDRLHFDYRRRVRLEVQ